MRAASGAASAEPAGPAEDPSGEVPPLPVGGTVGGPPEPAARGDAASVESFLPRVVAASAADHAAIHQLLMSVFHAPSRDAFYASLDDPFYEPRDRLLIKCGSRIVAHVHVAQRVMHFGSLRFPVAGLCWLSTMPEFRTRGYARHLLRAAEQAMAADRAVLGLLSTRIPHFFRPSGWAVCGRHSHARAGSRDLLAQLSARGLPPAAGALAIRPWRQIELGVLMRLYQENTARATGAYERTEAYWRWLISRKGYEGIYVALAGPDKFDLEGSNSPIVGYVVTKEDRVLELMASAAHPTGAEQLLARACSDAIERDYHTLLLHATPQDRLFQLFHVAGGTSCQQEAHQGEVFMVKLVDPLGFLRAICPELYVRAESAGLARPCELGLLVEGRKYRLAVSRRSVKVARQTIGRSYLRCNLAEFTRLVLGHTDLDEAIAGGRLGASTRLALETARALFPRLPFWRSPLDELSS